MIRIFGIVAVLAAVIGIFQLSPVREVLLVIAGVLFITIVVFYKLTIRIDDEVLKASFGIGLIRKRVRVAQITGCEPIQIRWWYGWGIHLTPYGWLYNIAGWDAVAITLESDQRFALGTDDPEGVVSAIRRLASAR